MEKENTTAVSIPKELTEEISKRIEGTGFSSISSYVTYVLKQVISGMEIDKEKKEAFSEEDEEKVKKRLRALGYM